MFTYSFSSRLINYTEPFYINGLAKTAIYTEVNTNINPNDKVFIMNGIYDYNKIILENIYLENTDGYTVLSTDKCKIVLDIEYNENVTYTYYKQSLDDSINVYNVTSQRQFDYYNTIFIDSYTFSDYYLNGRVSKFEYLQTSNIIFSSSTFSGISNGISKNNGIYDTNSFWVKRGEDWYNITDYILNNNYLNKINMFIIGSDFTLNNLIFKERNYYRYNTSLLKWEIDILFTQPIITKLNFRKGTFKGIHNDGIFGSLNHQETWDNLNSTWNSGIFLNSIFNNSIINQKITNDISYKCYLINGYPKQILEYSNNDGFSYNYFINSEINSSTISNGNFINSIVNQSTINNGNYDFNNISNSIINNSYLNNNLLINSKLNNSTINNCQTYNATISNSNITSINSISIKNSDFVSYIDNDGINKGIIKLYITEEDYLSLDSLDSFYLNINKSSIMNLLTDDLLINLPIEDKYIFDVFLDDTQSNNIIVSLKTPNENKYNPSIINRIEYDYTISQYNTYFINNNNTYSIDIDLGNSYYYNIDEKTGEYSYYSYNIQYSSPYLTKDSLNSLFIDQEIINQELYSGVISNSNWLNGNNINSITNKINSVFTDNTGSLNLTMAFSQSKYNDNLLSIGNNIWIKDILDNNNNDISGNYTIDNIIINQFLTLKLTSNFDISSTFSFIDNNCNIYLSPLKINNSNINSGLFNRTLIDETTFNNNNIDITSFTYPNIDQLILMNINFLNGSNTINNALIYKSIINNVNFNGGIVYNSIWNGCTFNDGIFNNSSWLNGTFNNGTFINSNSIKLSVVDYYNSQVMFNWNNGTFNNGTFNNSSWLNGTFSNGNFYNSDWYSGIWIDGILGNKSYYYKYTTFGNKYLDGYSYSVWYGGTVENALIGGSSSVIWFDGNFNGGKITSDYSSGTIWWSGNFNKGEFTGLSKWINGSFNGGKFTSYLGWTISGSTYSSDYSWEDGEFNSGEFGNLNSFTNSTWFNGNFNNGEFKGRVWNNGNFLGGIFFGSGNMPIWNSIGTPIYNWTQRQSDNNSTQSYNNNQFFYEQQLVDNNFFNSFSQSYYGLWINGNVTDINKKDSNLAQLQGILWNNGTFNHKYGFLENSMWLNGNFNNGNFINSIFNPYVDRTLTGVTADYGQSCIWNNGNFDSGYFNYSNWENGNFNDGVMLGGIWQNGYWYYGNAFNIYFINGQWKNGNWNGSPFYTNSYLDTNNKLINDKVLKIINNINNSYTTYSGNGLLQNQIHVNNIFNPINNIYNNTTSGTISNINISFIDDNNGNLNWSYTSSTLFSSQDELYCILSDSNPIVIPSLVCVTYSTIYDLNTNLIAISGEFNNINIGDIISVNGTYYNDGTYSILDDTEGTAFFNIGGYTYFHVNKPLTLESNHSMITVTFSSISATYYYNSWRYSPFIITTDVIYPTNNISNKLNLINSNTQNPILSNSGLYTINLSVEAIDMKGYQSNSDTLYYGTSFTFSLVISNKTYNYGLSFSNNGSVYNDRFITYNIPEIKLNYNTGDDSNFFITRDNTDIYFVILGASVSFNNIVNTYTNIEYSYTQSYSGNRQWEFSDGNPIIGILTQSNPTFSQVSYVYYMYWDDLKSSSLDFYLFYLNIGNVLPNEIYTINFNSNTNIYFNTNINAYKSRDINGDVYSTIGDKYEYLSDYSAKISYKVKEGDTKEDVYDYFINIISNTYLYTTMYQMNVNNFSFYNNNNVSLIDPYVLFSSDRDKSKNPDLINFNKLKTYAYIGPTTSNINLTTKTIYMDNNPDIVNSLIHSNYDQLDGYLNIYMQPDNAGILAYTNGDKNIIFPQFWSLSFDTSSTTVDPITNQYIALTESNYLYLTDTTGSKNILSQTGNYIVNLSIKISYNDIIYKGQSVIINIWMGSSTPYVSSFFINNNNEIYTIQDSIYFDNSNSYQQIYLQRKDILNVSTEIINFSIELDTTAVINTPSQNNYHNYNNSISNLLLNNNSLSFNIDGLSTNYIINNNINIYTNFGNGKFGSQYGNSIWTNGYWLDGYWNNNTKIFSSISNVIISNNYLQYTLNSNDTIDNLYFNIGQKVTVGNVVMIDKNGFRKLITGSSQIIGINYNTDSTEILNITLKVVINTNIRTIVQDSLLHPIKVSKTLWLSGLFLNGLFEGIWNYGMVIGYPFITAFKNTNFIDGIFNGGQFLSSNINKRDGLIQNFIFNDNNVADSTTIGGSTGFKYNSWINVIWNTESTTNISKGNYVYNKEYKIQTTEVDLNGYITNDVLSSKSYFRNGYNSDINLYNLGIKSNVSNNLLGNSSNFNYSYSSKDNIIGMNSFFNEGWTYSGSNNISITSNTNPDDTLSMSIQSYDTNITKIGIKYILSGGYYTGNGLTSSDFYGFNRFSKYNNNNLNINWFPIYSNTKIPSPGFNYTDQSYNNLLENWDFKNNFGINSTTYSNSITYSYWTVPEQYDYTLGLNIPFYLDLNTSNNNINWIDPINNSSQFKIFATIEYCNSNDNINTEESSWIILKESYLLYDSINSNNDNNNSYGGGLPYHIPMVLIDVPGTNKYDGTIWFTGSSILYGSLIIDSFSYTLNKGDKVRFNIYTITGKPIPNPPTCQYNSRIINQLYSSYNNESIEGFPICSMPINFTPDSNFIFTISKYTKNSTSTLINGYNENNSGYFEITESERLFYIENSYSKEISKNRYSEIDVVVNNFSGNFIESQPSISINNKDVNISIDNTNKNILDITYDLIDYINIYDRINILGNNYTVTNISSYNKESELHTILNIKGEPLIKATYSNSFNIVKLNSSPLFFMNNPSPYSPNYFIVDNIKEGIYNPTEIKHYFYNRNLLRLYCLVNEQTNANNVLNINFGSISFNELDYIPFFRYFDGPQVDNSVIGPNQPYPYEVSPNIEYVPNSINKDVQIPISGISPKVNMNYTFDMIGNNSLKLELNLKMNTINSLYYLNDNCMFFANIALIATSSTLYNTNSIYSNRFSYDGRKSSPNITKISTSGNHFYMMSLDNPMDPTYSIDIGTSSYTTQLRPGDNSELYGLPYNVTVNGDYPLVINDFSVNYINNTDLSNFKIKFTTKEKLTIDNDWSLYSSTNSVNWNLIDNTKRGTNLLVNGTNSPIKFTSGYSSYFSYTYSFIGSNIDLYYQPYYMLVYKVLDNIGNSPFYTVKNFSVNPNPILGTTLTYNMTFSSPTYSILISGVSYSTPPSGRRYATIQLSDNSYAKGITISNSNVFIIEKDGTLLPKLLYEATSSGNYTFMVSMTTSNMYYSTLFDNNVYYTYTITI